MTSLVVKASTLGTMAWWSLTGVGKMLEWVPERRLLLVARCVGFFFYQVLRYRRKIVLGNVATAFPTLTSEQQHDIARDSYTNLALTILWFLRLPKLRQQDAIEYFEVDDDITLDSNSIVLSGHLGAWEMLPWWLSTSFPHPQAIVYRPLHQPTVNAFVQELRQHPRIEWIPDKNCFQRLQDKLLHEHSQLVGLVSDQRSSNFRTRTLATFLGQPTYLPTGAARLHSKTSASIYLIVVVHNRGFYHTSDTKPFKLHLHPIRASTIASTVQDYANVLSNIIHTYPSQYLWTHRLWQSNLSL